MTRVLILGAGGMLGHKMFQRFPTRFETVGVVRETMSALETIRNTSGGELIAGVDAAFPDQVAQVIRDVRPDFVINCVGVIKQRPEAQDEARSMQINAELPHQLARFAAAANARVVNISTDCVFSGDRGHYSEDDTPDPVDIYGRSKLLGEVDAANALTLRTSMVGRELRGFHSLVEWFLHQPPGVTIQGFTRAIFSGLTNIALADEIARLIVQHPTLTGLYHVSAEPISKYDLLSAIHDAFGLDYHIVANATFHCDRSLVSDRYRRVTGFQPPSWQQMVNDLANDPTPYAALQAAARS